MSTFSDALPPGLPAEPGPHSGVTIPETAADTCFFGRYRAERELGRGGMGVVYLAHDERLGIQVALKFLSLDIVREPQAVADLKKEILRGFALTHPGLVRIHGLEQDATSAAIVMEYVDGLTLTEMKGLQPGHCFDAEQLLGWTEQLCGILEYAHGEARIIHRDLKPRNLLITRKGKLKVADFGLASSLGESVNGISVRKESSGTPAYMSPQQMLGELPTPADDIYSLGASLYELLTSKPPFYTGNLVLQAQTKIPPPMEVRRRELGIEDHGAIPPAWEETIAACLAKDPADRPRGAQAVWARLTQVPERPGIALAPPPESAPSVQRSTPQRKVAPGRTAMQPLERYDVINAPKGGSWLGGLCMAATVIGLGAGAAWILQEVLPRKPATTAVEAVDPAVARRSAAILAAAREAREDPANARARPIRLLYGEGGAPPAKPTEPTLLERIATRLAPEPAAATPVPGNAGPAQLSPPPHQPQPHVPMGGGPLSRPMRPGPR